jgi:hypothetical protein
MFPTPFEELMREGYHKIDDAKTSELRKGLADIIGGQTSSGQAPEAPPPPSVPTAPGLS